MSCNTLVNWLAPWAVALAACSKSAPADRVTCEQLFEHVGKLADYELAKPYSSADIQFCESMTQEQLRCMVAAIDQEQVSSCSMADTGQRAIATRVSRDIRQSWPGTATPKQLISAQREGCVFVGVVGGGVPPTDNDVIGEFGLRLAGQHEDLTYTAVRLRRAGTDWSCVQIDDRDVVRQTGSLGPSMDFSVSCAALASACRARPAAPNDSPVIRATR